MRKQLLVLVAVLVAALLTGCATAAPASPTKPPAPTVAPTAPATVASTPVPTKPATPASATTAVPAPTAAGASSYPNKPITWIVPYAAGQGPDLTARYIATEMEKDLGQKVIVDDKPGGGTVIGTSELFQAKPDGYTIGWVAPWSVDYLPMIQETPYKGISDFTPIAGVDQANGVLGVRIESPYKTLKDLTDDAKKNPGKVRFGIVAGLKGLGHVQVLQISKWAGVEFNIVPINTAPVTEILNGTLDAALFGAINGTPQVKAGKMRILLMNVPSAELPGVPLNTDLGLEMTYSRGAVLAPNGIPADVSAKLTASIKKVVESNAFRDFKAKVADLALFKTPDEIVKQAATDAVSLRKVASEQGWLLKP